VSVPAVALVDPETPGNVGTVARAMKNFGFSELLLVDPPELDPDGEAYGFAGRAREDVLPAARQVDFDSLLERYTVGFTAVTNEDARKHTRFPFDTPGELAAALAAVETDPVLVFGRERVGLTNDELADLDRGCAIPASPDYPVLNLGQAATVALYELRGLALDGERGHLPPVEGERADPGEVEGLHDQFGAFLDELHYPDPKREKTRRLFRRLVGRADPTGREARTLRGVLRRAAEGLRRTEE
jgi:tRNA (cytidine32/uridine32-2'-O)-methyltransferase